MIDLKNCAIVYDNEATKEEHNVADYFYKKFSEKNSSVVYRSDIVAEDLLTEILIGNTNRAESVAALETLRRNAGYVRDEDFLPGNLNASNIANTTKNINFSRKYTNDADFIIKASDKKVAIMGTNARSMQKAVDFFMDEIIGKEKTKLPENYIYYYTPELCLVTVNKKPIGEFKIVLAEDSSFIVRREAEKLRDIIQDTVGNRIQIVNNDCAKGMYEILIGETNREESAIPTNRNKCYIKLLNNKLVICGGHTYSTAYAVKQFVNYFKENTKCESFDISADYCLETEYKKDDSDYNIVFADEFDGNKLDTSIWSYKTHTTPAHDGGVYRRTPENVRVENGQVIITAKPEEHPNYSSGYIYTPRTVEYVYGYAEIHAKLPKGYGVWPAFWMEMDNQTDYQEIDCFELFTNDSSTIYSTIHKWHRNYNEEGKYIGNTHNYSLAYTGVKNYYHLENGKTFNDDYHTFGVEWTPEEISFYCDGHKYFTTSIRGSEHDLHRTPVYLIMCIQVAQRGSARKPDETTPWPAEYKVDWVHLYQKPNCGQLKLTPKKEDK